MSFLLALAMTPILTKLLVKYRMGKQIRTSESAPVFSKMHAGKSGTPTMGGIVIWLSVLIIAGVFFVLSSVFDGFWQHLNFVNRAQTYLPIVAMAFAALLGLADDILGVFKIGGKGGGLRVSQKLIVYTALSALGAWWFFAKLGWTTLYIPFFGSIEVGMWYIPIFMFVIVASAFSANETDGLDGLLGGVSLFTFGALTAVAFMMGRYDLAVFSASIAGATLAFLWFNIFPARFFMGDTGAMALGITMGVIAMLTNTVAFLPFFGFIMILESISVIIQMISKKIFKKKVFISTPIHHHFEAKGWPETQVTMRFWIISAVFAALGLVLFFASRFLR